ncbi:MAG: hypothetical protein FJW39_02340 [Acidobacteria bacterium]|nr:hypothetical protein [Acidobacteriota bacterium]
MNRLALLFLFAAALAQGAPAITAAANAASNFPGELPGGGLAQGGMFVVYGSGLGPQALVQTASFPLPVTLSGTSVRVTVGQTQVDCFLIYTLAGQVAAILPSRTPVGEGTLRVTYNGEVSGPFSVRVVRSALGIFTRNQTGAGPAIAQNAISGTEQPLNSLTEPVRPGQTVVLWGTGLGSVQGDEAAGPLPGNQSLDTEVYVGGRRVDPAYQGRSGCCAGLDQIAFSVPDSVRGCYVPVALRVNGVVSNFTTITVEPEGAACTDPLGPGPGDLERLRDTGAMAYGLVDLTRILFGTVYADSGDALFLNTTPARLASAVGTRSIPMGSCVFQWSQGAGLPDFRVAAGLDAGASVNATVASSSRQMLPRFGLPGLYSGDFNRFLEPGPVRVDNGPGSRAVGPFQVGVQMPEAVQWLNAQQISDVSRAQDLVVRWQGGDAAQEAVVVYGVSPSGTLSAGFYCLANPASGQFSVPAWVLSAMPAGTGEGVLGVGATRRTAARFRADGLEFGAVAATSIAAKPVTYR